MNRSSKGVPSELHRIKKHRGRVLALIALAAVVIGFVIFICEDSTTVAAQARRPTSPAAQIVVEPDDNDAMPPADGDTDGERLLKQEGYWIQRQTYPNGRFDA